MTLHLLDGHTFETLSGEALELLADDAPWNQGGAGITQVTLR